MSVESLDDAAVDVYWTRSVPVTAGSYYDVTGFVRGQNVAIGQESFTGPNLSVIDTWEHSSADDPSQFSGTFDWREVAFTFRAETMNAQVGARLGYFAATMHGKAFFDDLRMVELRPWRTSAHLKFILEPADVQSSGISETSAQRWLTHLETAYTSMQELTGHTPFENELIDVASYRNYPGGWAVAGNPIRWYQPYVAEQLSTVHNDDDWSFGILHELGHVFDLEAWNFDAEHFANFKLHYAVELHNGKVWQGQRWRTGGQDLEAYWTDRHRSLMEAFQTTGDVSALGDAVTYRFVMIKNAIGWEPFRLTFRAYQQLPGEDPLPSAGQRYNRFLDFLSQHSGTDVRTLIPAEELRAYSLRYP